MKIILVVLVAFICLDMCSSDQHKINTKTSFQGIEKAIVSAIPATGVAFQYREVRVVRSNMRDHHQQNLKQAIRRIYDMVQGDKAKVVAAIQDKLQDMFNTHAYVVVNFDNIAYYMNDSFIHVTVDGDNVFGIVVRKM